MLGQGPIWTRILTAIALVGWLGAGCSTNKSGLGDGGRLDVPGDTGPGSGGIPGSGGGIASGGSNGSGGGSIGSGTGGASPTGGVTASGGASSNGGGSGSGGTSAMGGRAGTGGSAGSGAGGAGGSTRCAGLAGLKCPAGQYCEFMPGFCHYPDAEGTCAARPTTGCTLEYVPVCGCDGNLYSNDCARRSAGVSKLNDGMCNGEGCPLPPPPAGAPCAVVSVACTYITDDDPGCLHHSICRGDMTWGPRTITCGTP